MFKKLFKKKVLVVLATGVLLSLSILPIAQASRPRDYDSNAVLYGGAYSVSELRNKLSTGTGRKYQGSGNLTFLYNYVGMGPQYFNNLLNGYVYKDGHVTVNGRTVAKNVVTMGRHYMPGSTRLSELPYPVYWRKPSVSFASNRIPAFVYMNYDGSMAFAIIKSCGNPVRGVGVRTAPVPTYSLTINKYEDSNNNRLLDNSERMVGGFSFRITGNNFDRTVTVDSNGRAVLTGLRAGNYTVTEIQRDGWTSTTGLTQTVSLQANRQVWFGNRIIPVTPNATYSIQARKFEDRNGNGLHESNEPWLQNWTIQLEGNNLDRTAQTDGTGSVNFSNLPAGTYTVSEVMQNGWRNITPIERTVVLPGQDLNGYVEFGNQRLSNPVTPNSIIVQNTSLPTSGPAEAVLGTLGGVSLAGVGVYYKKGKQKLESAFKTIK